MITDKEIADKRNEVKMLRLERDEMLIRRQLAERQSELDDASPIERSVIGNLRSINTRQHKQICEHGETIGALRSTISGLEERDALKTTAIDVLEADLKASHTNNAALCKEREVRNTALYNAEQRIEGLEAKLSARKEDSRVLMKVAKAVDTWHRCMIPTSLTGCTDLTKVLDDMLEDYSDARETPVVTLKAPSIGTRVVSKNEDAQIIGEAKMRAVQALIGCGDTWILHLDVDAVEVAKYYQTIDELTETTKKLEGRLSSMYAANSDQHTTIDGLKDFIREQGGSVDDRDKRIEQLIVLNEALRVDIDDRDSNIEELRSRMRGARVIIDNQATTIEEKDKSVGECLRSIDRHLQAKARLTGKLEKIDNIIGYDFPIPLGGILNNIRRIIKDKPSVDCGIDRHITEKDRLLRKLEKIEKIAEHPAYDCFSTALDEIIKIIQEE